MLRRDSRSDVTIIAFVECVLNNSWEARFGYPHEFHHNAFSQHHALDDSAEVALVDLGGTRRYFRFSKGSIIQLVNNIISFKSKTAEELSVDDSKKFSGKKRIDE